jgi:hypothetical protein
VDEMKGMLRHLCIRWRIEWHLCGMNCDDSSPNFASLELIFFIDCIVHFRGIPSNLLMTMFTMWFVINVVLIPESLFISRQIASLFCFPVPKTSLVLQNYRIFSFSLNAV